MTDNINPGDREMSTVSVETQLAVLRVKMDQLIEMNQARGEDHERRLRKLEERRFPLQTVSVLIALAAVAVSVLGFLIGKG
jgi:hypothetical protein